jgi:hypothetical protein
VIPAGIAASARVAQSAGSAYETEVLADSPFFYFPGDDTAAPPVDQMGNVVPTSTSGITFGDTGVGDRATAFGIGGAASAGITLPALAELGTPTALTIEILAVMDVWASADEIFRWSNVVSIRHAGTNTGVNAYFGGTTSGAVIGTEYTVPNLSAVHHWAITWDGTTAKLYDNGTEVRSKVLPIGAPGTNLVLGGSPDATNRAIDGRFGGVAWYTSALSAARILAHAQAAGVV